MTAGELLRKIMPRLTGPTKLPLLDALQIAIDAVTDRLIVSKSSQLRADLSQSYLAEAASIALSSSFLGFYTHPWIDGQSTTLLPLLPGYKHTFTQTGTPLYFEERGRTLKLYPTPAEAGTLKGEIFSKPTAISSLSSTVPWNGDLDNALVEITLYALQAGASVVTNEAFEAFVRSQVDGPSHRRLRKGICWRYPA